MVPGSVSVIRRDQLKAVDQLTIDMEGSGKLTKKSERFSHELM